MEAASTSSFSAAIVAIADPSLHQARYPEGESLLWRDAGAFLATAALAAQALGLESRILGIAHVLDRVDNANRATVVGALALGAAT